VFAVFGDLQTYAKGGWMGVVISGEKKYNVRSRKLCFESLTPLWQTTDFIPDFDIVD
jgi:hypothetical protein